jgi:hypothetical protein
VAQILAPLGYNTYSWVAPNARIHASQATLAALTVTNPVPNSTYTVYLTTHTGCIFVATYTLSNTTVGVGGIARIPSCSMGTSGSATVMGSGSGSGYNYTWYNSNNSVVSTSSVVSGLAPGLYSVVLSASGSSACGTASTSVLITTTAATPIFVSKPFCSNQGYLFTNGGSNFQRYNNLVPISSTAGGTAPSYTVLNPTNNTIYRLSYTSSQGCRDSVIYTFFGQVPGSLSITNPSVCANTTNGTATISLPPLTGSQGLNYFVVNSFSNTAAYSASLTQTSANSFTLANLSANGFYTVEAFDGSCKYSSSFTAAAVVFDFSLTPATPTICSGTSAAANILLSQAIYSAFSYSWSPPGFISSSTQSSSILSPTTSPGTQTMLTLSIVVTPTAVNCPLQKTFSVLAVSPAVPTIAAIPNICTKASQYTIAAGPSPGYFSGTAVVDAQGVLHPALSPVGTHTVYYVHSVNGCSASQSATFQILQSPTISVSGNTNICIGQTTTLTASGASTYLWSNNATSAGIVVAPPTITVYVVTGANAAGCSETKTVSVNATAVPTLNVSGNQLCSGKQATLIVSGALSYSWSSGNTGTANVVPPIHGSSFTVTGFNTSQCKSTVVTTLTVTPTPTITLSGSYTVCSGDLTSFTVSGAQSYSWSNGSTNSTFTVIPKLTNLYSVTGFNSPGNCSGSKSFFIYVDPCTGLSETDQSGNNLEIFPNPSSGVFNIHTKAAAKLSVYDLTGKLLLVQDLQAGKNEMSLARYGNGTYLVKIESETGTQHSKILVSH